MIRTRFAAEPYCGTQYELALSCDLGRPPRCSGHRLSTAAQCEDAFRKYLHRMTQILSCTPTKPSDASGACATHCITPAGDIDARCETSTSGTLACVCNGPSGSHSFPNGSCASAARLSEPCLPHELLWGGVRRD